ncbi:unnamed protein product [Spirodela intermedia]|uniref:Large ribosomal subunit protein bL28m n=1 Tax=Spirodela intermedia TaxID=51605 RepID=A0A7I8JL43_SPIIN|nr:unnamed protein product [Spirodela intermedia]CAA6670313.1 unnamed protein product [Spirodela intermedia]
MAFRSQQLYKKMVKKVGDSVPPKVMESMKKSLPNSKLVMEGPTAASSLAVISSSATTTRRTWKPNVQEKRLFSYALDRHIRVKVTTHALRCIDKAGGIDEYLLKTPYQRMDTEMGLLWKAKIEKLYQELGQAEAFFFSPEEEARIEAGFEEYRAARGLPRRAQAKTRRRREELRDWHWRRLFLV